MTGTIAARSLDVLDVPGVHTLPSEGDNEELRLAADALASVLIDEVRAAPTGTGSRR